MRARSGCAECALVTRAVYDAHPPDPARARGDVPRHGLSLLASSQKKLGLADRLRARSVARKTNHSHGLRTGRAMRRESRAVDPPCRRKWFSRRQLRRTGARTVRKGGRRPPASVASGTGLPSGACEAGSGGGRARTPSVARLGAASRVRSRSSVAASRKPALRPNGFTNSAK